MNILVVLVLLAGIGYGVDNEWKVAKGYKTYQDCRAENPKVVNTMTNWTYDPCNMAAYKVKEYVK